MKAQGYAENAIETTGEHQMTPLMRACRDRGPTFVQALLTSNIALSPVNRDDNNAFWLAATIHANQAADATQ